MEENRLWVKGVVNSIVISTSSKIVYKRFGADVAVSWIHTLCASKRERSRQLGRCMRSAITNLMNRPTLDTIETARRTARNV